MTALGRGGRAVVGYLEDGAPRLDAQLREARLLARERLPGGARALLAQFIRRLDRHMRLEEHVLFPALDERAGSPDVSARLLREHDRLRALAAEAAASLDRDDARTFLEYSHELAGRLQRHHQKERRLLDTL